MSWHVLSRKDENEVARWRLSIMTTMEDAKKHLENQGFEVIQMRNTVTREVRSFKNEHQQNQQDK